MNWYILYSKLALLRRPQSKYNNEFGGWVFIYAKSTVIIPEG